MVLPAEVDLWSAGALAKYKPHDTLSRDYSAPHNKCQASIPHDFATLKSSVRWPTVGAGLALCHLMRCFNRVVAATAFVLVALTGVVSGAIEVDLKSGAAEWHYPFDLPAGRHGHTPAFGIAYHSQRGLSDFGYGMRAEPPAIRRTSLGGTPRYDESDELTLDGELLVSIGTRSGIGDEYRLLNDTGLQLFRVDPVTWLMRRPDGGRSLFVAAVVDFQHPYGAGAVYSWQLANDTDALGNEIEYAYVAPLNAGGGMASTPRLSSIFWGKNERITPKQPHIYELHFFRESDAGRFEPYYQTALVTERSSTLAECIAKRGPLDSFAAGGPIFDAPGVKALAYGAALLVAEPGVTETISDEPAHEPGLVTGRSAGVVQNQERARRIARVWKFSYNWDRVGCDDVNNLWPQLEEIQKIGVDLDGHTTAEPPTRLSYNDWSRDLEDQSIVLPYPETGIDFSGAMSGLQNGLTRSISNYQRALGSENRSGTREMPSDAICRRDTDAMAVIELARGALTIVAGVIGGPWASLMMGTALSMFRADLWLGQCGDALVGSGAVNLIIDVNGDAVPDFLRLSDACIGGGSGHDYYSEQQSLQALAGYPAASIAWPRIDLGRGSALYSSGNWAYLNSGFDLPDGSAYSYACGLGQSVRLSVSREPGSFQIGPPSLGYSVNVYGFSLGASLSFQQILNSYEGNQYYRSQAFLLDVNADGIQDLVIGSLYHLGNGDGTFQSTALAMTRLPWAEENHAWNVPRAVTVMVNTAPPGSDFSLWSPRTYFEPTPSERGERSLNVTKSHAWVSNGAVGFLASADFSVGYGLSASTLGEGVHATRTDSGTGLSFSDQSPGVTLDLTGDGLPDHLATYAVGEGSKAKRVMMLFVGTGPGQFAEPFEVLSTTQPEWIAPDRQSFMSSPGRNFTVGVNRVGTTRTIPLLGDFSTNQLMDINGDGLADMLEVGVTAHYSASRAVEVGTHFQAGVNLAGFVNAPGASAASTASGGSALRNVGVVSANLNVSIGEQTYRHGAIELAPGVKALRNYGQGFTDVASIDLVASDQTHLGRTVYRTLQERQRLAAALGGGYLNGVNEALQMEHWVDYNGDGFTDFVGQDYWRPNVGGRLASPVQLPVAQRNRFRSITRTHDQGLSSVGMQMLIDMNADGLVDVLSYGSFDSFRGSRGVLFTDRIKKAPGALVAVRTPLGAETRITYEPSTHVRRGNKANRSAWVVTRVETTPSPGAVVDATTYSYQNEVTSTDPLLPGQRPSFVGYQYVTTCSSTGLKTVYEFDYTAVPTGLEKVRDSFVGKSAQQLVNPTSRMDSCEGSTIQVSHREQDHVAITRSGEGGRSYRQQLLRSSTAIDFELPTFADNSVAQSTSRIDYYYRPNSLLLDHVVQVPDLDDPSHQRVVAYEYDLVDDERSFAQRKAQESVTSSAHGLLSDVRWKRDGAADATGLIDELWVANAPGSFLVVHYSYDQQLQVAEVKGPSGKTARYCYDRFGLFPIRSQQNDLAITDTVYDYATALVLSESGPIGRQSTGAIVCPAANKSTPSFAPRITAPIVLTWPKAKQLLVTPPAEVVWPTQAGFSANPASEAERSSELPSDDPQNTADSVWTRAVGAPRAVMFFSVHDINWRLLHARTVPAASLPDGIPSPLSANAALVTTRVTYDGLGAALRVEKTTARASDGSFRLSPVALADYDRLGRTVVERSVLDEQDGTERSLADRVRRYDGYGRTIESSFTTRRHADLTPALRASSLYSFNAFSSVVKAEVPAIGSETGMTEIRVNQIDGLGRAVSGEREVAQWGYVLSSRVLSADATGTRTCTSSASSSRERIFDRLRRLREERVYLFAGCVGQSLNTRYVYDTADRVAGIIAPDGTVNAYEYDFLSRVKVQARYRTETDFNAGAAALGRVELEYDDDGQMISRSEKWADGTVHDSVFAYDHITGWLVAELNPHSSTPGLVGYGDRALVYQFDARFDGYGQPIRVVTPSEVVSVDYDGAQRPKKSEHELRVEFDSGYLQDKLGFTFDYTSSGQLRRLRYLTQPSDFSPSASAPTVEYVYNNVGQLQDVLAGSTLLSHYEYGRSGEVMARYDYLGDVERRSYYASGHLRASSVDMGAAGQDAQLFEYTPAGFVRSEARSYASSAPMSFYPHTARFDYDGSGRMTAASGMGYSANLEYRQDKLLRVGRYSAVSGYRSDRYEYGSSNEPAAVTAIFAGSDTSPRAAFGYRADGALVSSPAGTHVPDPLGVLRTSGLAQASTDATGQRAYQADGLGRAFASVAGLVDVHYKRVGDRFMRESVQRLVPGYSAVIARLPERTNSGTLLHRDYQGSEVLSRSASGTSRRHYSVFGELLQATGGEAQQIRGFEDGVSDWSAPGLVMFGARTYDPSTLNFTSIDPLRYQLPGNPYHFSSYNWMGLTDPSGLQAIPNANQPSGSGLSGTDSVVEITKVVKWTHQDNVPSITIQIVGDVPTVNLQTLQSGVRLVDRVQRMNPADMLALARETRQWMARQWEQSYGDSGATDLAVQAGQLATQHGRQLEQGAVVGVIDSLPVPTSAITAPMYQRMQEQTDAQGREALIIGRAGGEALGAVTQLAMGEAPPVARAGRAGAAELGSVRAAARARPAPVAPTTAEAAAAVERRAPSVRVGGASEGPFAREFPDEIGRLAHDTALPLRRQSGPTCGPTVIEMIAEELGIGIREGLLADMAPDGMNSIVMRLLLRQMGIRSTYAYHASAETMFWTQFVPHLRTGRSVVAGVRIPQGKHWIIVDELRTIGGRMGVVYRDPHGRSGFWLLEEFLQRLDNGILIQ